MPNAVTFADVAHTGVAVDSIRVERRLGQRAAGSVRVAAGDRPTRGQVVGVYDSDSTRLFGGTVDEVSDGPARGHRLGTVYYDVLFTGWEQRLEKIYITGGAVYGGMFVPDPDTDVCSMWGHNLEDRQPVRVATSGTLPAGLAPDTTYYVRDVAANNTFKLAASVTGAAIDITDAGTGSHRLLWQARDVVNHILATHAPSEGVDTSAAQEGAFLEKRVYDEDKTVAFVLTDCATLSGYTWSLNPEIVLYFAPPSLTAAPWDITATSTDVESILVRDTREDMRTREHIRINWAALSPDTQDFSGDDASTVFWLDHRAIRIDAVSVDGTPVAIGTDGVDTGADWYWSPGERIIRQDVAGTVLATGQTLTVVYRRLAGDVIEVVVGGTVEADLAAVEGGSGRYDHYTDDSENTDAYGAVAKANAWLDIYSAGGKQVTYKTRRKGLAPGQLQTITIAELNLSGDFLIESVTAQSRGWETFIYTVVAVQGLRAAGDYVDFFKGLATGSGGGSSSMGVGVAGVGGQDGVIQYA